MIFGIVRKPLGLALGRQLVASRSAPHPGLLRCCEPVHQPEQAPALAPLERIWLRIPERRRMRVHARLNLFRCWLQQQWSETAVRSPRAAPAIGRPARIGLARLRTSVDLRLLKRNRFSRNSLLERQKHSEQLQPALLTTRGRTRSLGPDRSRTSSAIQLAPEFRFLQPRSGSRSSG